jgi:hypothetical protein
MSILKERLDRSHRFELTPSWKKIAGIGGGAVAAFSARAKGMRDEAEDGDKKNTLGCRGRRNKSGRFDCCQRGEGGTSGQII